MHNISIQPTSKNSQGRIEDIMGNDSDDSYERVREQVTTYRSIERSPTSKLNNSSIISNPYGYRDGMTSILQRDAS